MIKSNTTLRRRLQIVELVRKENEVKVEDLSKLYGVSSVTIRSDLSYLEEQGYLFRSFGKAKNNLAVQRSVFPRRSEDPVERGVAENAVARASAALVADGESVFLGAGRITHKAIPFFIGMPSVSLLVHDLSMVPTIRQFLSCELALSGGVVLDDEPGLFGPSAEHALISRAFDVSLLEVSAIDQQGRVLSPYPGAARLYRAAVKHAKRAVALSYQPDFGATEGHVVCNLGDFQKLVLSQSSVAESMEIIGKQGFVMSQKSDGFVEFVRA